MESSGVGSAGITDIPTLIRQVARHWDLVLVVTLAALTASVVALDARDPSYRATARLLVSPLPQWDQTFLGTSLIRDSNDARLTASTVAETLKTPNIAMEAATSMGSRWTADAIRRAVTVKPVPDTNVIEVTARSRQAEEAFKLAVEYAKAAITVRWRVIEEEISRRTALAEKTGIAIPNEGGEGRGVEVLNFVRQMGSDPTLTYGQATPAQREKELHPLLVVLFALAGGLFLGAVAALGIDRLRPKGEPGQPALVEDRVDALSPLR